MYFYVYIYHTHTHIQLYTHTHKHIESHISFHSCIRNSPHEHTVQLAAVLVSKVSYENPGLSVHLVCIPQVSLTLFFLAFSKQALRNSTITMHKAPECILS